jgi:hypothetical protein
METEWVKMYYNGLETNIECKKDGSIRRIKVDWSRQELAKLGEVDFSKLTPHYKGYNRVGIVVKGIGRTTIKQHQAIAATFLGYEFKQMHTQVDHIDNDVKNNNLSNLQLLDNRANTAKSWAIRKKNKNLPAGVFLKDSGRYAAVINLGGNYINLGRYDSVETATKVYQQALQKYKNKINANLSSNQQ